jgi:hypothetical protein
MGKTPVPRAEDMLDENVLEPDNERHEIIRRARAALVSDDGLSRDESLRRARAAVERVRSRRSER